MSDVINQIRSWAATELKYWERAALEKISERGNLTEQDFEELLSLFMEDAGLISARVTRPRLSFPDNMAREARLAPWRLERLFNLKNVNALPDKQEIRFGQQLTLIYGDNGTGKTGYARPLAAAGFARGEREVLPNAERTGRKGLPQADIEVSQGDTRKVVTWTHGQRCSELDGFYIFDGTSLNAHLTRSNSLSFSPSGLSLLTNLAEITDMVRDRVRLLIDNREVPRDFQCFFEGESETSKQIKNLSAQMNFSALEKMAKLNEEEIKAISDLELEIARLRLLDVPQRIAQLSKEMTDLTNLVDSMGRAQAALGESVHTEIQRLIGDVRDRSNELERSGTNQFTSEVFTQIGSSLWLTFVNAAKQLADAESNRGTPYPSPGDRCLLCWQSLSPDAIGLIQKFWEFLKSDAQARLEAAERACADKARVLEPLSLNYFAVDSNVRRLIESELQHIIPAIEAQIEACAARRVIMLESLRTYQDSALPPLINVDIADIQRLHGIRQRDIVGLRNSDVGQQLTTAISLLRELKHRQILCEKLPEMKTYVEGLKWAGQARRSLGTTAIITTQYNKLFKEIVTERFRSLFEEVLKRFKSSMRVTIETRGFKGETVRQIVLHSDTFGRDYSLVQILSDGEKRAVAIADFLTEVTLDEDSNGVILDDPVTSLDEKWKVTLARYLVEQAKTRQVIVFTHDLSFLYHIKAESEELSVDVVNHWIQREDGRPGFVYLNNSPVCEKDYKSASIARELYAKAKSMAPAEQQTALQQGFGALRTSYEALIIFGLFNGVVGRFEETISFGRLKDICIDRELVEKVIQRMEVLSRYIDAHLHSDAFARGKPSVESLFEEIEAFESLRKQQQQLMKKSDHAA